MTHTASLFTHSGAEGLPLICIGKDNEVAQFWGGSQPGGTGRENTGSRKHLPYAVPTIPRMVSLLPHTHYNVLSLRFNLVQTHLSATREDPDHHSPVSRPEVGAESQQEEPLQRGHKNSCQRAATMVKEGGAHICPSEMGEAARDRRKQRPTGADNGPVLFPPFATRRKVKPGKVE